MSVRLLVVALIGAAGLAAGVEWLGASPADEPALRIADGVVGWVIVAGAILVWRRRPTSRLGLIFGLAAATWFAGALWPALGHLHRGPLVHVHVSYPSGRLRWWAASATVGAAYLLAVFQSDDSDLPTIALSVLVAVVAAAQFARTRGTARRAGVPALFAAWTFAGVLGVAAYGRRAGWDADSSFLWAYYVAVGVAITALVVDFLRARWAEAVATDLVVELARLPGSDTLAATLGRALGDPTLVLAYPLATGQHVDGAGGPVDVADPGPGRVATPITRHGAALAVVIHDVALLDDPALVESLAAGAGMALSNAQMRARSRERVDELAASHRRLVEACELQRRRFGRELHGGLRARLERVAAIIDELRDTSDLPCALIDEFSGSLDEARRELDDVAQGLDPQDLDAVGLYAAICGVAERLGSPFDVSVTAATVPPTLQSTVYYLCAEALTNAAKHAGASRVHVAIDNVSGVVTAAVLDDGSGGADAGRGSGLRGLADRVASIGGELSIESPLGAGTTVLATIPT